MHLKGRVSGVVNLFAITFAVLFIAIQISIFVSILQIKRSFTWLFKRIIAVKVEKV